MEKAEQSEHAKLCKEFEDALTYVLTQENPSLSRRKQLARARDRLRTEGVSYEDYENAVRRAARRAWTDLETLIPPKR